MRLLQCRRNRPAVVVDGFRCIAADEAELDGLPHTGERARARADRERLLGVVPLERDLLERALLVCVSLVVVAVERERGVRAGIDAQLIVPFAASIHKRRQPWQLP